MDTTLDVPITNQYPAFRGPTLGSFASATSRFGPRGTTATTAAEVAPSQGSNDEVARAVEVGRTGNPIVALLVLAAMLFLLMFGAHKVGADEDFKNIRMSFFNVLVIGWAAIIGIWGWKIVFTKVKVPGLSTIVLGV